MIRQLGVAMRERVCSWEPAGDGERCGWPAAVHFMVGVGDDRVHSQGWACDLHAERARAELEEMPFEEHPVNAWCGMPGFAYDLDDHECYLPDAAS